MIFSKSLPPVSSRLMGQNRKVACGPFLASVLIPLELLSMMVENSACGVLR
jgi:hypothetical protein